MGFKDTAPLTFTACNDNYFTVKYADHDLINKAVFVGISVASVAGVVIVIAALAWLVKRCKNSGSPSVCSKSLVYVLVSLMVMGTIIPAGYYLTFIIERN